jgi:molybdate transport system substrate-binding protein
MIYRKEDMVVYTRQIVAAFLFFMSAAYGATREVAVAAAANLTDVMQSIGTSFEAATGIHPVFSYGSTAQLTQQLENFAPFDVFAAADTEHVEALDRKGLLEPHSRAEYAIGILAMWIPPQSRASVSRMEDLTSSDVRIIAAAKPELAPYGQAALESLRSVGIWDRVKSKVVYAANISMARQYGTSGNADVVFTAYSLVRKEAGKVIPVDEKLHPPIAQALGIMAASKHPAEAKQFVEFVLRGKGRDMLAASGYRLPPAH